MLLYIHTSKTANIYYVVSGVQFLFCFKFFFYPVNGGGTNQRIRQEKKNQGLSLVLCFSIFPEMFLLK